MNVDVSEASVRPKNQVTLPERVLQHLGAGVGDRLVFEAAPDDPDSIVVRAIRRSYAGTLAGVYGRSHQEIRAYLRDEHEAWDE
jgi:bifunctional DNA-binding transcriptional regulator/antitoxin component of YhaV-PrlF toxin-antitoxin module